MTRPVRPELGVAMELDALLAVIEQFVSEGDRGRYTAATTGTDG